MADSCCWIRRALRLPQCSRATGTILCGDPDTRNGPRLGASTDVNATLEEIALHFGSAAEVFARRNDDSCHELIKRIGDRVYVRDKQVAAMTLRSNSHLVVGHSKNGPTYQKVGPYLWRSGSDGDRPLTCKIMVVMFLPRYTHQDYLSQVSSSIDIAVSPKQPVRRK